MYDLGDFMVFIGISWDLNGIYRSGKRLQKTLENFTI